LLAISFVLLFGSLFFLPLSVVKSPSGFSPIRVPDWATYYDPDFKGWQVALVVILGAVGVVLIVSFVVLLTREKPEYESID